MANQQSTGLTPSTGLIFGAKGGYESENMKIAFIGSRDFSDKKFVEDKVDEYYFDLLISGGASGVDTWAEEVAKTAGKETCIYKPDWDKFGKRAGLLRNEDMVNAADKVVAFWNGNSRGTKYTIDYAVKQQKPVDVYIR